MSKIAPVVVDLKISFYYELDWIFFVNSGWGILYDMIYETPLILLSNIEE